MLMNDKIKEILEYQQIISSKYRFTFEYVDFKSHGSKLIRANNLEEAKELFNETYKGYNIEIKEIKKVK